MHHSFDIHLAEKYGIEEAIIIHHIQHWIRINKKLNRNFYDGRTWMYQSIDEIAANFPYMTKTRIYETLEKLCTGKSRRSKKEALDFEPVLMKGNYNQTAFDRTTWYAFVNEEMFGILATAKIDFTERQNQKCQMPRPIPDTITDTDTNTLSSLEVPALEPIAVAPKKKAKDFDQDVKDTAELLIGEMRAVKDDYVAPKNLAAIHQSVDAMMRIDGRSVEKIITVLRWALADSFWSPHFFKPNPAKYLREKFDQLEMKMNALPEKKSRKFLPCSDDDEAVRTLEEMRKRAL